ncbi:hypothetical protein BDF14DRAFT_1783742 [Spinellus fusiger]|nr:hypothetical protein BDF14DRAFT_1783742 [Spinellus fusiger]
MTISNSVDATDCSCGFIVAVCDVCNIFKQKEADSGNIELLRLDASVSKVSNDKVKILIEFKSLVD